VKKTIGLSLLIGLAIGTTAFAEGRGGFGFRGHFFDRLDANADGKVTREEVRADAQRRFAEFDLDKNGKIDASELKTAGETKLGDIQARIAEHLQKRDLNHDGQWSKDELSRMPVGVFTKLDKDGNGVLTRAELEAGRDAWSERHGHGEFMQHVFNKIDSNGDGVVDSQEAVRAADNRFDRMDANHDGVIVRDELKMSGHGKCDRDAAPAAAGTRG
jgi:Ca2+-binding EF-hand superfamily protein